MLAPTALLTRKPQTGFLLAALWAAGLSCPASGAGSYQNTFDVWQVEAGWQQSAVTTIVQSRDSYLWLGTYHGLLRFDGVRFQVFDSGNTPGLQNGLITSLYPDPEGVLWI